MSLRCVVLGQDLLCVMCGVGTCPSDVWCWGLVWCLSCEVLGHVPRMCGVGTWPGVWLTRCWEGLPGQVVLGRGVRGDGAGPPAAGEWHRGTASAVPLNLVLPPVVLAAA